jgi:hypothetical protein
LQILKVLIITYVVVFGEIPRQLTGPFTAVHMGKSDSPAAPVSNKRANPNPHCQCNYRATEKATRF